MDHERRLWRSSATEKNDCDAPSRLNQSLPSDFMTFTTMRPLIGIRRRVAFCEQCGSKALSRVDWTPSAAMGLLWLRLFHAFHATAQFHQTVAQLRRALEFEVPRRAEHLLLHVLCEAQHL